MWYVITLSEICHVLCSRGFEAGHMKLRVLYLVKCSATPVELRESFLLFQAVPFEGWPSKVNLSPNMKKITDTSIVQGITIMCTPIGICP